MVGCTKESLYLREQSQETSGLANFYLLEMRRSETMVYRE
jgi:hypothetical protein